MRVSCGTVGFLRTALGTRREKAREARVYEGSLTKTGKGTPFLTGDQSWHGTSRVFAGKLSVAGSHASSIVVSGGTLGDSGTVADDIAHLRGALQPGLSPDETARITDVERTPGNTLNVGDRLVIARKGDLAVAVSSESDYTSVRAAGEVVLAGELTLDAPRSLRKARCWRSCEARRSEATSTSSARGACCTRTVTCSGFRIATRP